MIDFKKVILGGQADLKNCYIATTPIEETSLETDLIKNEIFGPILPILTYEKEVEIDAVISKYEKPLALYIFTENRVFSKQMIQNIRLVAVVLMIQWFILEI